MPTSEHFGKRAVREWQRRTSDASPAHRLLWTDWLPVHAMYSYPRVARCDPASIQLPGCMYRMSPVSQTVPQPAILTSGSGGDDDRSLQIILSEQERLINRLQRIEDGFVQLCGVSGSDVTKTKSANELLKVKSHSSEAGRNQAQSVSAVRNEETIASILQRQQNLIQRIDQLAGTLQQALTISSGKQVNTSPITRQIVTDVAVFVEMGSSIHKLYRFFQWLRDEKKMKVLLRTHYHSSTLGHNPTTDWADFNSPEIYWRAEYEVTVTLIVTRMPGAKQQVRSFIDPAHGVVAGEELIVQRIAKKLAVDYTPKR